MTRVIIKRIFLLLNLAFAAVFLLSCLAPYVSPEKLWPVAFLGFAFLPLLLANICWIFLWLIFKRRYALFSTAAIALSWWNISCYFSFAGCTGAPVKGDFSVMSFNVKVFNLYDWTHNEASKNAIIQVINNADADVVCLQEFYTDDSEQFNTIALLQQTYPYFHFHKTLTLREHNHWGIATFSKFPIANYDALIFSGVQHNLAILTDVVMGADTVRVFNAHLQSIYLGAEEYEGMQHLEKEGEVKFLFWRILDKLHKAFIKRASQAELLAGEIARSPYRVLVCADFNDTPNSYTYRTVSNGLNDSFKEAGCGMGRTYSKPSIFRIDYILGDETIQFISHKVIWNNESDHYAVKASFELK